MISVESALELLNNISINRNSIELPLAETNQYVLSTAIYSPINMPPFNQSAMDGFAVKSFELKKFKLVGEIKAGDSGEIFFTNNETVKIFTGAIVPNDVLAIIPIEKCKVVGNEVYLEIEPRLQDNIRSEGEQIKEDEQALSEGTELNTAGIGFLASLGITKVSVYRKPKVAIITTGNELTKPGVPLKKGKVYESNSIMLEVALSEITSFVTKYHVLDDYESTVSTIKEAITENDVVLITGGISVGDYDFVYKSLNTLQVVELFYKVDQKPGKPLYSGKIGNTIIFGLPGNPAAVLTCYYIYVLPYLNRFSGKMQDKSLKEAAKLNKDLMVDNVRNQFLKAFVTNDGVEILTHQNSSMLNSFAVANALVYVKSGKYELKKGDEVTLFRFRYTL